MTKRWEAITRMCSDGPHTAIESTLAMVNGVAVISAYGMFLERVLRFLKLR